MDLARFHVGHFRGKCGTQYNRLNAAGRLADMSVGIQCLITDDGAQAAQLAAQLSQMNNQRKRIELEMKTDAVESIEDWLENTELAAGVVIANEKWHQGVVGILASRIKDRLYRPTIAMAPADDGSWRGSGRSIAGVHLRDVLDLVSKRLPEGAMPKFGGHAMAAGLSLQQDQLENFKREFAQAVSEFADAAMLTRQIETDGSIPTDYIHASSVDVMDEQVWGQGFPSPLFADEFEVLNQRILKETHSKFTLRRDGKVFTALRWNHVEPLPVKAFLAYRFERDTFSGGEAVQLIIEHCLNSPM